MAAEEHTTIVSWDRVGQSLHVRVYGADGRLLEEKVCSNVKQLVLHDTRNVTVPGDSIDTKWVVLVVSGIVHVDCKPSYTILRSGGHGHSPTTRGEE